MHRDLVLIQRFLQRLRLRSATLMLMELALIWVLSGVIITMIAAAVGLGGFSAGWAQTIFWISLFLTPSIWLIKICWPRHLPISTLEGAARHVDAHNPQLKTSVLSALELGVETLSSPTYSSKLVEVVVSQAAHEVQNMHPGTLVPNRPVRRSLFSLCAALLMVAASFSVDGAWVSSGLHAFFTMPVLQLQAQPELAGVTRDGPALGDIQLTLNYPGYLNRESEVLENAVGSIKVPLGTLVEIQARVSEVADGASLAVTDQLPTVAELVSGKRLSGAFTVAGPGHYWFIVTRGGRVEPTQKYEIEIEADSHPTIELDGVPDNPEVPATGQLDYAFRGRDDHGLLKLDLLVSYKGKELRKKLKSFPRQPDSVSGSGSFFPQEWDVAPGSRVEVWLEVQDNDTVSGPKVGRSRRISVQVSSDKQRHENTLKVKEALKEALLVNLGEQLVWALDSHRVKDLHKVNNEHHMGRQAIEPVLEGFALLREAVENDALEDLAVFTALLATERDVIDGWDNLEASTDMYLKEAKQSRIRKTRLSASDASQLDKLRSAFVVGLERAVLSMESFANLQRLESILSSGDALRDEADDLWESLKAMEGEMNDKQLSEMLGKVENIEQKLSEMMREMSQLDRRTADWFQNPTQETAEMKSALDEIRDLMKEGKTEEAMEKLQEYMEQMEEMMSGLEEMQDEEFEDVKDDATKEIGQVIDGIKELEQEQERLARDTEAIADMVEQSTGTDAESLDKVFEEALEHTENIEKSLKAAMGAVDGGLTLSPSIKRRVEEAIGRNDMLRSALQSKNLINAFQQSEELQSRAQYLAMESLRRAAISPTALEQKFQDGTQVASAESSDVHDLLSEIMHKMSSARGDSMSQSQATGDRQGELRRQSQQVAETLEDYAKDSPYIPQEWSEQVRQAAQNMQSAGEKMQYGELRTAAADQKVAKQALQNLREQMEESQQAMQEGRRGAAQQMAQRQSQQQGQGQGTRQGQQGQNGQGQEQQGQDGQGQGRRENWGGGNSNSGEIQILQQGEGGADYREALMEGMKGDTPDLYKRQNRAYYEKLVE